MGIPKFARFILERYPLILKKIKESTDVPEIDNLYLDINGIIHKRAHNNSLILMCKERTLEDIFYDIFRYIDDMVHLIKPKKVLLISADGVAPRAKMNQQRSRRFRKTDIDPKEKEALRRQGLDQDKMFNSDCISAGTEFMFQISKSFHEFVQVKMKNDPLWKELKVILTGVEVPGEGEHKIIEYVKNYKNSSDYVTNTKHCIYGLDADLIMLSLITHEPNICILREEVFRSKKSSSNPLPRPVEKINESFEFIYISILREYLELEFLELKPKLKFEYNIERIIDDFVFFCFFIGNDFLPSLNTLDIDQGALDKIFLYYKEVLPKLDDYITFHGKIDFTKAEKIFERLSTHEINNISKMITNIEKTCAERDKKKLKAIEDRKKLMRSQKILRKKENYLVALKIKGEAFSSVFKKAKINKKIFSLRKKYEEEIKLNGKASKFEEDIITYIQEDLNKKLEIENQRANSIANQDSAVTTNLPNITSNIPFNNTVGFLSLFDSDKEKNDLVSIGQEKKEIIKCNNDDNLTNIIKGASKYNRYIQDDNYCSDVNIDDIDEDDLGEVSEPEVNIDEVLNPKTFIEYGASQDMDKIFQQKLFNLYTRDVTEAKVFYYKEKLGIDLTTVEGQQEHKRMFKKYLEGLQWVLYYYYRGIQSWRWYYPYHYAPMISDFAQIKNYLDYDIDIAFSSDEPFTPFQSLLFILPKNSRSLYPKCYWGIFDKYPEFFPDNFQIDFNGKKMPWESIVLLPFIPEEIILKFERNIWEKYKQEKLDVMIEESLVLTEVEVERNIHGSSYIYTFNASTCDIDSTKYEIYQKFSGISNSNYEIKKVDYLFPTLKTINYDYTYLVKKKTIGKSKPQVKIKKVVYINSILNSSLINEDKIKSYIETEVIYINFPFKQDAILRGIFYNNQYYYLNHSYNVVTDEKKTIQAELKDSIKSEWNKKGVTIQNCDILCDVSPFKHFGRNSDGSIIKVFDQNSFYIPFELTSLNSHSKDFQLLNEQFHQFRKIFTNIETEFSKSKPTLILSKVGYCNLGRITNVINKENNDNYDKFNEDNYTKYYDENNNFDLERIDRETPCNNLYSGPLIEVEIKDTYDSLVSDHNFAKNIIENSEEEFITLNELAKNLNLSDWKLGFITSSLFVVNCANEDVISDDIKVSELEHWNIGLNMKTRYKNEKFILPGYTRYTIDTNTNNYGDAFCWQFSKKAVQIIVEYREKFPFVFECLEKYNSYEKNNKFFRVYELFSAIDNCVEKLTDVAIWINSTKISTLSYSSSKSNFLSIIDCEKIEEYVLNEISILKNRFNEQSTQLLVLNPNYLFQESIPKIYPFFENEQSPFLLGDRVVSICSSDNIYIPFGATGTVTAYTNEFLEVLFDSEFFGGSNMNGRFGRKKAGYVKPLNLINITRKHPIYLRRKESKYNSWNFVPSYTSYENYCDSFSKIASKQNDVKKKGSCEQKQLNRDVINLEKTVSDQNLEKCHNDSFNQQKPIQKHQLQLNTYNFRANFISRTKSEHLEDDHINKLNISNPYLPKLIISAVKSKINPAYKTYPEGAVIKEDENFINNEIQKINVSEYRNDRIFSNETLKANEIYYYSIRVGSFDNMRNKKIIAKQI